MNEHKPLPPAWAKSATEYRAEVSGFSRNASGRARTLSPATDSSDTGGFDRAHFDRQFDESAAGRAADGPTKDFAVRLGPPAPENDGPSVAAGFDGVPIPVRGPARKRGNCAAVSLDDFYAYIPQHSYLFVPTREMWPASSFNSRISADSD